VITADLVSRYTALKKKSDADKEAKEASAKAAIKAKAVAKKKAAQAVEDDWLNDGKDTPDDNRDDDSDDDMGFRMFSAGEFSNESRQNRGSGEIKPLKVKNLIDFGECDVVDELEAPAQLTSSSSFPDSSPMDAQAVPSSACGPASSASSMSPPAGPRNSGSGAAAMGLSNSGSNMFVPPQQDSDAIVQDLLGQIEHLRQMLADSSEEKNIQVAIVQDEVAEKNMIIEELKRKALDGEANRLTLEHRAIELEALAADSEAARLQRAAELEAAMEELHRLREAAATTPAPASGEAVPSAESVPVPLPLATEHQEELDELRARVEKLTSQLVTAQAAATAPLPLAAEREEELYQLRAEVENLRSELVIAQMTATNVATASVEASPAAEAAPLPLAAEREEELAQLRKEVEELRLSNASQADPKELDQLRFSVEELRILKASKADTKELDQLKIEVEELRLFKVSQADTKELDLLRTEVEELRLFKASQVDTQEILGLAAPREETSVLSPVATSLMAEMRNLCGQTCQALAEDAAGSLPGAVGEVTPRSAQVDADPEACLRHLREICVAAHAAAQRSSEERRCLVGKLSDAEASALEAKAAAVAARTAAAAATVPASPSMRHEAPAQPADAAVFAGVAGAEESPEVAAAVGRQAALALREVRLNAERQLAWITKRIKMSHQADISPCVDAFSSAC
jgi:hypothetical protein